MTNFTKLLEMPDKKLERNLVLVQKQIVLASKQRNTRALLKLQEWELEIIKARFLKSVQGD